MVAVENILAPFCAVIVIDVAAENILAPLGAVVVIVVAAKKILAPFLISIDCWRRVME